MAELWRRKRELELLLRTEPKSRHAMIRQHLKQLDGEILLRQDEPWPEDVERDQQGKP